MIEVIVIKYNQPYFENLTLQSVLNASLGSAYHLTSYQNVAGMGLGKCWNRLIARSDAKFIVLLNSDTQVTTGWLEKMRDTFEHYALERVGMVQPSSCSGHKSTISDRGIQLTPGNWDSIHREERRWNEIDRFGRLMTAHWDKALATGMPNVSMEALFQELDVCSAFCLMFPKEVWHEAGGFDEEFFLYGEDSEFSRRVQKKLGYRLIWRRDVYVHHYGQRSVQKAVENGEFDYASVRRQATELCCMKDPSVKELA